MPMYNVLEYSDDHLETSGSLQHDYRDEPALINAGAVANFPGNSTLLKFKSQATDLRGENGTKVV